MAGISGQDTLGYSTAHCLYSKVALVAALAVTPLSQCLLWEAVCTLITPLLRPSMLQCQCVGVTIRTVYRVSVLLCLVIPGTIREWIPSN